MFNESSHIKYLPYTIKYLGRREDGRRRGGCARGPAAGLRVRRDPPAGGGRAAGLQGRRQPALLPAGSPRQR